MREAIFNTEVMNSLKALPGKISWAYKIADSPTSWTMDKTRFTPDKPCDIVACIFGEFVAIESKQIKKWEAFGMRHLRDVQIANLDRVHEAAGHAFVFLNVRVKRVKGVAPENRLIIFEWARFKVLTKKGSIKAADLKRVKYIQGKRVDEKVIFDLKDWASWL